MTKGKSMLRHPVVFVAAACLAWQAELPCDSAAQAAPARFPITTGIVASTLERAGVSVASSQVELPVQLSTESPSPHMVLGDAERLGDTRLRVRLVCASTRDCLPFFVGLTFPEKEHATTAFALLSSISGRVPPIRLGGGPVLRAGDHTTLLLEDDHMRISLPVISIDTGAVGAAVRVSTLDRKKTYQAVVLGAQSVKGELP